MASFSFDIINTTLDFYQNNVVVCFNGGKDSIVMLDIILKVWEKRFPTQKLPCLYIKDPDCFQELDDFVFSLCSS
jgi:predicted phosphoadenosine phosphosulfate sulfurtransferase